MPLPRILLVAAFAMFLLAGVLWAMNVNYIMWVGAWFSPGNQLPAGAAVFMIVSTALVWFYARYIGEKFPGPGALRGLLFGVVIAATAIWVVPPVLHGIAGALGNTQVVFQGRGIVDDQPRADESRHLTEVPPCPPVFGVDPPLSGMTANKAWASSDAWQGRLLPFGIAFLIFGVVTGAFLSEKTGPRK